MIEGNKNRMFSKLKCVVSRLVNSHFVSSAGRTSTIQTPSRGMLKVWFHEGACHRMCAYWEDIGARKQSKILFYLVLGHQSPLFWTQITYPVQNGELGLDTGPAAIIMHHATKSHISPSTLVGDVAKVVYQSSSWWRWSCRISYFERIKNVLLVLELAPENGVRILHEQMTLDVTTNGLIRRNGSQTKCN